jgi:hypothetical protein
MLVNKLYKRKIPKQGNSRRGRERERERERERVSPTCSPFFCCTVLFESKKEKKL